MLSSTRMKWTLRINKLLTNCWQIVDILCCFIFCGLDRLSWIRTFSRVAFSSLKFRFSCQFRIRWSELLNGNDLGQTWFCSSFLTSMRRQSVVRISPCLGWSVSPSVGFSYPVRYPLRHVGAGIHFRRDAAPVMPLAWLFVPFVRPGRPLTREVFRWSEDQKGEIEYKHFEVFRFQVYRGTKLI